MSPQLREDKVRFLHSVHSDMSVVWRADFDGSISTSTLLEGRIMLKYSDVPDILYALAKEYGDLSFIGESSRDEILAATEVSFAAVPCNRFVHEFEWRLKMGKRAWDDLPKPPEGAKKEDIEMWKLMHQKQREYMGWDVLAVALEKKGIPPTTLEPICIIPGNDAYYSNHVHVLKSGAGNVFLSQKHQKGPDVVRLKREEVRQAIVDIMEGYGVPVSACLKPLLEAKKTQVKSTVA